MDFPSITLLTQLGIEPLTISIVWFGWQLVKTDREIKTTLSAHDKRLFELELRKKIAGEQGGK